MMVCLDSSSSEGDMPSFSELLQPEPGFWPPDQQRRAGEQFPALARSFGFEVRTANQALPHDGNLLLIGLAASYSRPELQLLDEIAAAMERTSHYVVGVFDVSQLQQMQDLDNFIPGLTPVYQTPVVGLWKDRELIVKKKGHDAIVFLEEYFHLRRVDEDS